MNASDSSPGSVVSQVVAFLAAHPAAGVAAVDGSGLFVPTPVGLDVGDHPALVDSARAGIALVAPESRTPVLEQFRQLPPGEATEVDVVLTNGKRGRYVLFDTRVELGVVMLVLVEGEAAEGEQAIAAAELAKPKPRYGRIRRTDTAQVIEVDDALLEMTGYDRATFEAITTTELVHPDDQEAVINQWFDMLNTDSTTSRRSRVRYRRGDGTWLWIELTVTNHLDDPDDPHVLSEVVDISDEMAAHDEIWRHRELLARLTDALPVGVVQIDTERRIIYSNDRAGELFGLRVGSGLDDALATVVEADRERAEAGMVAALDGGDDVDVEVRVQSAGLALPRYLHCSLRPLRDREEVVVGAVVCLTDVTDSTRMRKELEVRATTDVLTGCFNRGAVMAEVEAALQGNRQGVGVVFIDLDDFKQVNDDHGHAAGDRLLQAVAGALREAVRADDVVGRLGGDEFLVVCPMVIDQARAVEIASRLETALRMAVDLGDSVVEVGASIGVAWAPVRSVSAERLVADADAAMYLSKRQGQGRPVVSSAAVDSSSG